MTEEDFPFLQKRFLEEFEAWSAVEQIDPSNLLAQVPALQKLIGNAKAMKAAPKDGTLQRVQVKKTPAPQTTHRFEIGERC
jgi:hypothetical protein